MSLEPRSFEDSQKKIIELENRVQHLERMLGVLPTAANSTAALQQEEPLQKIEKPKPSLNTEVVAGSRAELSFLGSGGVLCLALACIYLVKLAVDAGWLTPVRQVVLAAVFGGGLISMGLKLKIKDKEYLSYLPAAGVVILLIAALGGSLVHHLYPPMMALLFTAAISVGVIYIYDRLRLFPYLIISKIGAYLAPFAFRSSLNVSLIQVYFLLISMTYTVIAVMLNFRPITVLAAYFGLLATSVFGFADKTQLPEAALYLACQALIFFGGVIYHSLSTKIVLTKQESLLHFPLILFFYGLEYAIVSQLYPDLAPFMSIGFAVFLFGVYAFMKAKFPKDTEMPSEDLLMSSAFSVLVHSLYFVLLPESLQPILLMTLLLLAAYFYHQVYIPTKWPLFRRLLTVVGAGLLIWNYVTVLMGLVLTDNSVWLASGFFMSGGLLGLLKMSNFVTKEKEQMPFLLYLPHLLMASSLYALLKNTSSFAVTSAWAIYALAILAYGAFRKDADLARSSIVILILSSLKVFFFDLSGTNTVGRVLSLFVASGLLYVAGWVFRKI